MKSNKKMQTVSTPAQRARKVPATTKERLLLEVQRRKTAEKALADQVRRFHLELKKSEKMIASLRGFSRQILLAQEKERKKISRDLHDVVAQALTIINIRLATLNREASIHSKSFGISISRTQKLLRDSALLVHQFARQLRPAALDDLGLRPALQAHVKGFSEQCGIPVRLSVYAESRTLSMARRTALYRIAQEGLSNIARHARAESAEIIIRKMSRSIRMTIQDNGVGFDIDRKFPKYGGRRLGLLGMQERVEMVGGTFEIKSTPDEGTLLTVELPVKAATKKKRQEGKA